MILFVRIRENQAIKEIIWIMVQTEKMSESW